MKEVKEWLQEQGEEWKEIAVPEDLEKRLRTALDTTSTQKKKTHSNKVSPLIAACLVVLVGGVSLSTYAYYERNIKGYESVMSEQLQALNQLGKGQIIDEKYTCKNGTELTLDGVMVDDSQFLLFYTIDAKGEDVTQKHLTVELKGLKTYNPTWGQGEISEDSSQLKMIQAFDPVAFYEKNLTLKFGMQQDDIVEQGEIPFVLDRKKAMGHTLKVALNKKVQGEDTTVRLETLLATPTRTTISGVLESPIALALRKLSKGEKFVPVSVTLGLKANGDYVEVQGGGQSTNRNGTTFTWHFDALPQPIVSLELMIEQFKVEKACNEVVSFVDDTFPKVITVEGQAVTIDAVRQEGADTLVTITTKEEIRLSQVYGSTEDEKIALQNTEQEVYEKTVDGINYTRTLRFSSDKVTGMTIERIVYPEVYDYSMQILPTP